MCYVEFRRNEVRSENIDQGVEGDEPGPKSVWSFFESTSCI